MSFTGAVLAGGRSARMGRDKAFVEVGDAPLVSVANAALRAAGAIEVVGVGGDLTRLAALGMRAVPDDHPGEGPLGGILTALRHATTDVVVVLSCDLVACRPEGVQLVVAALDQEPAAHAAIPVVDARDEPLHAAYRRSALGALERAFAAGIRAPRDALADAEVIRVEGLDPRWVADANTPSDLPGAAG